MKDKSIDTMGYSELPYYDHPDFNPYFVYVAGGIFLFTCVNFATRAFIPPTLR